MVRTYKIKRTQCNDELFSRCLASPVSHNRKYIVWVAREDTTADKDFNFVRILCETEIPDRILTEELRGSRLVDCSKTEVELVNPPSMSIYGLIKVLIDLDVEYEYIVDYTGVTGLESPIKVYDLQCDDHYDYTFGQWVNQYLEQLENNLELILYDDSMNIEALKKIIATMEAK